jgi:putative hemin transport protein
MPRPPHALQDPPSVDLREAWEILRVAQPNIRPREASLAIGVSEAELVATSCGTDTIRLAPPWTTLVADLAVLGRVVAQTRTARSILEQRGTYPVRTVVTEPTAGIEVHPLYGHWHVGFAHREGGMRQLAFYDRTGTSVHKVFVVDDSRGDAWEALAHRHAHPVQAPIEHLPPARPSRVRPDAAIDAAALKTGWAALKGTEGIDALLETHGTTRLQALRVVGPRWAARIPSTALARVLRQVAVDGTALTITVANRGAAQAYRGPLQRVYTSGRWLNARALDMSLQVRADRVATAWLVRAPLFAGVAHALEFYDAAGEPVLRLSGARDANEPDPDRWATLVTRLIRPETR